MAKIVIDLTDEALVLVNDSAKANGFTNANALCKELLVGTVTQIQLQLRQREITKLEAQIRADIAKAFA